MKRLFAPLERLWISEEGGIFNKHWKRLKTRLNSAGYESVNIGNRTWLVHRLLAISFIPNPLNLPWVNHKDGNKLNNELSNLEWSTKSENAQHAIMLGLTPVGSAKSLSKLTEMEIPKIIALREQGQTYIAIAKLYGTCFQTISKICYGQTWKHAA